MSDIDRDLREKFGWDSIDVLEYFALTLKNPDPDAEVEYWDRALMEWDKCWNVCSSAGEVFDIYCGMNSYPTTEILYAGRDYGTELLEELIAYKKKHPRRELTPFLREMINMLAETAGCTPAIAAIAIKNKIKPPKAKVFGHKL
ncbi:MAG: hypothetical protein WCP20_17575 [Desulfuromonadales bacterium]